MEEIYNIYEFLIWVMNFASTSITNFIVFLIMFSFITVIFSAITNFRLFTIVNKSKENDKSLKHSSENLQQLSQTNNSEGYVIYDMLIQAYDKWKNKKS